MSFLNKLNPNVRFVVSYILYLLILVDCLWGPWKTSQCSTSCGNGTKILTRSIFRNETNGGKPCSGTTEKVVACDYERCPGKLRVHLFYITIHFAIKYK